MVTISFGRWDTHGQNFRSCRTRIPKLDIALSTLVEDLYLRGLDKDVSVVVWGEFGRTPKINKDAGRDHWPPVNFALLAGGGMRTGQVIGSTDKTAGYAKDRPISFQNVFATLYHNLGIDPAAAVTDRSGRPMYLLEEQHQSASWSDYGSALGGGLGRRSISFVQGPTRGIAHRSRPTSIRRRP